MIDKVSIDMCCLCGNCAKMCPKDAISFSKEENLFKYPVIYNDKCIKCDICETVCPALNIPEQTKLIKAYAVKNKDVEIQRCSTSGGLFSALAQTVISNGGVVYGAAFTDDFTVKHIAVDNIKDLALLRGSKYLQSDLGDSFNEIVNHLKNGGQVLFSGCPCQNAALKSYLNGKQYEGKLFAVDFICHGILSDGLFKEYINYLEKKNKSKIIDFQFRAKVYNWSVGGPKITYQNGKVDHWPIYEDRYMQGNLSSICMKESCYTCKYKDFHSGSDITISDFWGIEQILPEFYDPMGVSALCIQTNNGVDLFNHSSNMLESCEVPVEYIIKYNKALTTPFPKGPKSNEFFELAGKVGHMNALLEVTKISNFEKIKRLYRKIKRIFTNKKI